VGVATTALLAWLRGGITHHSLCSIILSNASGTAMVFFIVLDAAAFNTFLALSQLPQELANWVGALQINPYTIFTAILVLYLILGCVMDSLSMILLTVTILFLVVIGLDFGMTPDQITIWFGVLVLIVVEVGLITPPVGLNLFIIQAMAPDIPVQVTYRGVMPFLLADILRVALLIALPSITLWLPSLIH
jgi:TRAP-type C4-dicarboxylate transport system permease large subunit